MLPAVQPLLPASGSSRAARVWCLSDGRSGHRNKTQGLVEALRCGLEVKEAWIDADLWAKPLRRLMRYGLNGAPGTHRHWIEALYRDHLPDGRPDIVLSTGGNTSFLNVALARRFHCQNYFIGSLRGLNPKLFSLVFTLEPIAAPNNILMPVAPSPFTTEQLSRASASLVKEQGRRLYCMLIGGRNREYLYTRADWLRLAQGMNSIAERDEIRWLVTTSPRTGNDVEGILASALAPEAVADAVWYASEPRAVMPAYLGASLRVYCTEDSMSMLSEAIHASKPVIALKPRDQSEDARYEVAVAKLAMAGWLVRESISSFATGADESVEPGTHRFNVTDPRQTLWKFIEAAVT